MRTMAEGQRVVEDVEEATHVLEELAKRRVAKF